MGDWRQYQGRGVTRLIAAGLACCCLSANAFDYGDGEVELWSADFSNPLCCLGWLLPEGFSVRDHSLQLLGGPPWSAVDLKTAPRWRSFELKDGPVFFYLSLRMLNPDGGPERSKVFLELGTNRGQPEDRQVRLAIRPVAKPWNNYYQLSADPGWKLKHDADVLLVPPENHFTQTSRIEHYRMSVEKVDGKHLAVMVHFWTREGSWQRFDTILGKKRVQADWATPSDLPLLVRIGRDSGDDDYFNSVRVRFREPGWMAVPAFAVTQRQTPARLPVMLD